MGINKVALVRRWVGFFAYLVRHLRRGVHERMVLSV